MGWFNEDSGQALAYSTVINKPVDASWNVNLIAGAAAYEASKAYENEVAKNNRLPSVEIAKEILNAALQAFVDRVHANDFDKEQAKEQAKKQAEDALAKLGGIDPRKIVSKEKLEEVNKNLLNEKCEGFTVYEAPEQDMREMEKLLGIAPESLGAGHFMRVPQGLEQCGDCGRHYSFLDLASSGIAAHKSLFMKDVLTGKYGYIYNVPRIPHAFKCYDCGKMASFPSAEYWCPIYGC